MVFKVLSRWQSTKLGYHQARYCLHNALRMNVFHKLPLY